MDDFFLADKPISEEKDDRFQRYNFSKRIAETIVNRTSKDSIVIGLYGAWGEGKTSVLNFIKQELSPYNANVIHFTFNPWRFTDETTLLTTFFNILASELKKIDVSETHSTWKIIDKIKRKKGDLKTNSEAIGEMIATYGKAVTPFGIDKIAETIGKVMSDTSIEELKARIEKLLIDNKKRIVIFIDDIDRLEKNEIHAIFRLVKLTGDFAYTTYLLSFDENIVSSAIGERFGAGDQKAGINFLEKIIQIPLKLPLAQKTALQNYCFELIEQSLHSNQIKLTDEEAQGFGNEFVSNFVIRLTTPRLAVRYGNALSFSLPLLKGEVNYIDLLLIEAIRVFYPELYDFIRDYPDYFIGTYGNDRYSSVTDTEKVEKFKKLFGEYTIKYSPDEIAKAKDILLYLFLNLDVVWKDHWTPGSSTLENRYNQKRISTTQYFNRYFSYTVIEGDISDVAFTTLLDSIAQGDYKEKIESIKYLIQSTTPENFIEKIRFKEKTLSSHTSIAIVKIFSHLGDCFHEDYNNSYSFWYTTLSQAAIFLSQLIRYQIIEQEKYDLLKWVVENAIPFKFAYKIFEFSRNDRDSQDNLLTENQNNELANKLITRAKELSADKPIWKSFTSESNYMIQVWATEINKQELDNYVEFHLDADPQSVIPLLRVYVNFIRSSGYPNPYYGDFQEDSYDMLKQILDVNLICEKVEYVSGASMSTIENYVKLDHKQTDGNMMKQFLYWHKKNKDRDNSDSA